MSSPPDDRHPRAADPTGPTTAGVSPGSTFAPISLRPAVDVQAVQERLRQLGQTRSTDALAERAELLRLLGRLDEALVLAEDVFRLTMFTGERTDKTAARIRRAHVLHDLGRHERCIGEASLARDTARIEEWPELEGAAAELEGWSLFELNRFAEARTALARAYEAFRAAGAPAERTESLRTAAEAAMRASISTPAVAEPEDPQRAVRDAAARSDRPEADAPRRRVLGAPDAARTEPEGHRASEQRRPGPTPTGRQSPTPTGRPDSTPTERPGRPGFLWGSPRPDDRGGERDR